MTHGHLYQALNLLKNIRLEEATDDQLLLEASTAARLLSADEQDICVTLSPEARWVAMEHLASSLQRLLDNWEARVSASESPYEHLPQLRMLKQMRSMNVLREAKLLDQLPVSYQYMVVHFWYQLDQHIEELQSRLPSD